MKKTMLVISLLTTPFALTGCDSMRHNLGLSAYQPDEGNIQKNSLLKQPLLGEPEFIKLRPPRKGDQGAGFTTSQKKVQSVIGAEDEADEDNAKPMSSTEKAVMDKIKK